MKKKGVLTALGIVILLLVASILLVHTLFRLGVAQLKIRETLEAELSQEFEREVRVGDLSLGPFLNLIELRDVKVAIGETLSSGTLFEARRFSLHLDFSQVFRRTLFIKRISILEPRLLAEFDAQGASPLLDLLAILAAPPKRPRPVKLELSQITLSRGELHYKDARTSLEGEAKGITVSLNLHPFGDLERSTSGELEVVEGRILYRDKARTFKNLKGMGKLEEGDLSLSLLQAELDGANISLTGKVASLYKSPTLDLQVRSSLDVASFLPSHPFKASLQVDASVKGPLGRPSAQGSFRTARGSLWKIEVQDGKGEFRWSPGQIEIHRVSARALGGDLQGTLLLDLKREVPVFQASIETRDLDLSQVTSLIGNTRGLSLRGRLQAGLDIRGKDWSFEGLEGKGWARGRDIVLPGVHEGGRMEAAFRLSPGVITINKFALVAPPSEVLVSGKVMRGRDLSLSLETRSLDLRSLAAFGIPETHGLLKLKGNIGGRIEDPVFRGNMEIQGPRYKGMGFQRLAGPLELVSRRLSLSRLTLRQGVTEALVKGFLELPKKGEAQGGSWRDSILQLDINVNSGKVQDALSFMEWDLPIEGTFGLRGSISGRPSRLKGQASVSMTGATFWEEPAWAGEASLSLEGERFILEGFSFHRGQEKISGKGEASLSSDYSFEISTTPFDLARVKVLEGGHWAGLIRLSARGKGSFRHPQLQGELSLTDLAYKGLSMGNGIGTFSFKNQELRWESSLSDGAYRLSGSLKTSGARPYHLEASLQKGELEPLLAAIEHPFFQGAKGKAQGRMEFSGNLRGTGNPRGKAYFSMVELTLWGETLQNDKPVELSLEDGLLRFESFRMKREGSAGASAKARVQGALYPGKEWDFSLDGELGLALLQGFFPSIQGVMGKAQVSLTVKGPWKQPELKGVIQVRDGSLQFQGLPVPFEALSGTLNFEKEGSNLSFVEARLGGGRLTAWGKSKKMGKGTRYDMDFKLEGAEAAEIIKGKGAKEGTVSGRLNTRGKLVAFGKEEAELWGSLEGQVSVEMLEGRIRRYTLLAKIFSLLNVALLLELKLPDLFTEGMKYKSWKGDFLINRGVAETNNFFLDSDSMKISTIGKIDLARGNLDLTVGVQPLQTIDKVISNIPILGYILTGKEKSLISAYFEVKGPWDDPTVKPIPLKSLGRGILGVFRRFLEIPERLLVPGK